jgi:hypothetical protein
MIPKPLPTQSTDGADSYLAVGRSIVLDGYNESRPRLIDTHLGAEPQ